MQEQAEIPAKKVLRELSVEDKDDLNTVAKKHMELLGFGPMAGLGERFIREICYVCPVRDGLMRLALCEIDGKAAGFVAYTEQSISFHRHALKDHWFYAGVLILLSLLEKPTRVKALIRAIKVVLSRRSENKLGVDPMGEIVCIAVSKEYLTNKFVRQTGIRVSEELVRYAANYLQKVEVAEMRMLVDADNKAPLFLYHKLGASFEDYEQAGESMVQVWFDLQKKPLGEVPEVPESWQFTTNNESGISGESSWRDYWEGISDDKQFFRIEARDYTERLTNLIGLNPAMKVMDFGCGFGYVAEQLASHANCVYIWDKAKNVRTRARMRLAYLDNIVLAEVEEETAKKPQNLDAIFIHSVIQYMNREELESMLAEWRSYLVNDGQVVISDIMTPATSSVGEILGFLRFSLKHGFFYDAVINGIKEFYRYFATKGSMSLQIFEQSMFRTVAETAGFSVDILSDNLSYRNTRFTAVLTRQNNK